MPTDDASQETIQDLESRIELLENQKEAEFGSFSGVDYVILTIGAIVLPVIALVLAA